MYLGLFDAAVLGRVVCFVSPDCTVRRLNYDGHVHGIACTCTLTLNVSVGGCCSDLAAHVWGFYSVAARNSAGSTARHFVFAGRAPILIFSGSRRHPYVDWGVCCSCALLFCLHVADGWAAIVAHWLAAVVGVFGVPGAKIVGSTSSASVVVRRQPSCAGS